MGGLLQILGYVCGIGSLVCFILVLIQMFKRGQTGLGVACIVLAFCCGIGGLVAFIYGWMKAKEWNIQNIMFAWTGFFVVGLVINGLQFNTIMEQIQQQLKQQGGGLPKR
jgi:hypothetical protein